MEKANVRRSCLSCDKPFMARGRFNRICPRCTESEPRKDYQREYSRYRRAKEREENVVL